MCPLSDANIDPTLKNKNLQRNLEEETAKNHFTLEILSLDIFTKKLTYWITMVSWIHMSK